MLLSPSRPSFFFFFFNDTATTEIYTLSLHDALPIFLSCGHHANPHEHARTASRLFVVDVDFGHREAMLRQLPDSVNNRVAALCFQRTLSGRTGVVQVESLDFCGPSKRSGGRSQGLSRSGRLNKDSSNDFGRRHRLVCCSSMNLRRSEL